MTPERCPCCQRLGSAIADHAACLVFDDPALTLTSRTLVRLAALTCDATHNLAPTRWAREEYCADAQAGLVLPLADPIGVARRMTP
jgi:hypothetical protein